MNTVPPNEGARRLRERLSELGESQNKAEQELGLTKGHVSRFLSGDRVPDRRTAEAMRVRYGIPAGAWDEPPQEPAAPSGAAA